MSCPNLLIRRPFFPILRLEVAHHEPDILYNPRGIIVSTIEEKGSNVLDVSQPTSFGEVDTERSNANVLFFRDEGGRTEASTPNVSG